MDPHLDALEGERQALAVEIDNLQAMLAAAGKGSCRRILALAYGTGCAEDFELERERTILRDGLQERLSRKKMLDAAIRTWR